jgi:hypothetical protein
MGYAEPMKDCGSNDCWERMRHYCLCGVIDKIPGAQTGFVKFDEYHVRCLWERSRTGLSYRDFQDQLTAESNKASLAAMPAILTAQEALSGLGSDQALLNFRFCIRIDGIRICVETAL